MSFRQSHPHEPQPKTFCATVFCGADTPTLGCPGQLKLDMLPGHPLRDSNHVRRRRRRRESKLRRQDSNLNSQNQNLMCCRLHHDGSVRPAVKPRQL
jgi:hypothetical protein